MTLLLTSSSEFQPFVDPSLRSSAICWPTSAEPPPTAAFSITARHVARCGFEVELDRVYAEAAALGIPVSAGVRKQVARLVDLLPFRMPVPEPSISDAGDLILEWDRAERILSIIVEPDSKLYFASRDRVSGERTHGEVAFEGDRIRPAMFRALLEWKGS